MKTEPANGERGSGSRFEHVHRLGATDITRVVPRSDDGRVAGTGDPDRPAKLVSLRVADEFGDLVVPVRALPTADRGEVDGQFVRPVVEGAGRRVDEGLPGSERELAAVEGVHRQREGVFTAVP